MILLNPTGFSVWPKNKEGARVAPPPPHLIPQCVSERHHKRRGRTTTTTTGTRTRQEILFNRRVETLLPLGSSYNGPSTTAISKKNIIERL